MNGAGTPGATAPRRKAFLVYNTASYLLRFRRELMLGLREQGYAPHAVVPRSDPACEALERMGVPCIDLPLAGQGVTPAKDLGTLRYLYRLFVDQRPDLVLNFTIKPTIYASLAARLAGVPHVASMITGLGYVFTGDTLRHRAIRAVVRVQYRWALACNRTVFFQNPDDLSLFVRRGLVDASKAVIVNGSGVDLSWYARAASSVPPRTTFVLIARLLRDKGVREYVEAARLVRRRHPEAEFVLVGPQDDNPAAIGADELDGWVREGVVRYVGEVTDVRPVLSSASVFVLPSYREGTPRTTLEALAMGLPVITTDAPGCRETVIDGSNGFLVPVRDAAALADAMLRFVREPGLVQTMGAASRALAERRYDVREVTRTILSRIVPDPTTAP